MLLYISSILIAIAIISIFNIIFPAGSFDNYWLWIVLSTTMLAIYEIIVDLIFAGIIHSMPSKWFGLDKKFFQVSRKERNFYEKLNIRAWKDKVVELGALGGFRKNKVKDASDVEYLYRFIIESNKGIVIHVVGMMVGFSAIFILPMEYWLRIGLPVSIVNLILNILPTMILRYNMPKLVAGYKRLSRNEKTIENDK